MTVTFRTVVLDVPPSPLGLLPGGIVVEHWCNLCRHQVATEHLAAHARSHDTDRAEEVTATD
jgi:hypothetical protein